MFETYLVSIIAAIWMAVSFTIWRVMYRQDLFVSRACFWVFVASALVLSVSLITGS